MEKRTLAKLFKQESGVVAKLVGENEKLKHRLIDMGITPGVRITLERVAPMGDPLEITVRGYSLSLRRAAAENIILVSKEEEADQVILKEHQPAIFSDLENISNVSWIKILFAGKSHELKDIEEKLQLNLKDDVRWVYYLDIYLEILP